MLCVIVELRVRPDRRERFEEASAFQREADACLEPDGRTVTLCSPLLPGDIPEAAATGGAT